jgi:hypothetical protein
VDSRGNVRTVFVFTDLPVHIEFRAGDLPLLEEKTVLEFDLTIKNPRDPKKTRKIEGPYRVERRILKYETGRESLAGLTQYLEWKPAPTGPS